MAAIALFAGSGCSVLAIPGRVVANPTNGVANELAYNDTFNDMVLGWRNMVWAQQAWQEHKCQCSDHPFLADFGRGFRAGYEDVAAGGSGCPPVVPPRYYWSWKYQSPCGQDKVSAWYDGYACGALAADQEGIAVWGRIRVSPYIEQQYREHRKGAAPCPDNCGQASAPNNKLIDAEPLGARQPSADDADMGLGPTEPHEDAGLPLGFTPPAPTEAPRYPSSQPLNAPREATRRQGASMLRGFETDQRTLDPLPRSRPETAIATDGP